MNIPVEQPKVSELDARALEAARWRLEKLLPSLGVTSFVATELIAAYLAALPQPTTVGVTDKNWKRCEGGKVGASGECLFCDAEQGVNCHIAAAEQNRERLKARDHVLVKCADGHNNWMERGDRDGWRIQSAYCSTCGLPLYRDGAT